MIKIKVIDLLNKIANGEEVPKHIHIRDLDYYTWQADVKAYWNDKDENNLLSDLDLSSTDLREDIEIIEEDKKIKRIQSCGDNLYSEYIGQWLVNKENYTEYDELLMNKINEIIDYINKGE